MSIELAELAPTSVGASRMSAAEFRCLREWLGLTTSWVAEHVGVAERSVHRWEAGAMRVPEAVGAKMLQVSEVTYDALNTAVDHLMDLSEPSIWTYRTDDDYRTHHPELDWPASWHRALCARIADEVPGLRIDYWHG
ncbi:DUF1870 family protein [Propionicimonas sp.]|uniref:Aca2/YdiL-like domain-containing protein n=1 Tax=Propionicimonas sp. TaxID=1955623 RepID=UPI0025D049E7|nr:DUF1870 family protein [Propionicimonas sp.]MCG2805761.1 DUF1870 family protein [Propionicimonas sp.]